MVGSGLSTLSGEGSIPVALHIAQLNQIIYADIFSMVKIIEG